MSTPELTDAARQYREVQVFIRELQDEADELKAQITAEMEYRGVDTLQADIFTIKHTAYTTNRIDTTALREDMPAVAARYTRTTTAHRFTVQ